MTTIIIFFVNIVPLSCCLKPNINIFIFFISFSFSQLSTPIFMGTIAIKFSTQLFPQHIIAVQLSTSKCKFLL